MTPEEFLAEARRLAGEATPGPWGVELGQTWWVTSPDGSEVAETGRDGDGTACEDAIFIAHARTALPRAVAALEAVLQLIEEHKRREDHNDKVPLSRIGELMREPSSEHYRRAIDDALNEGEEA